MWPEVRSGLSLKVFGIMSCRFICVDSPPITPHYYYIQIPRSSHPHGLQSPIPSLPSLKKKNGKQLTRRPPSPSVVRIGKDAEGPEIAAAKKTKKTLVDGTATVGGTDSQTTRGSVYQRVFQGAVSPALRSQIPRQGKMTS